MAETILQIDDRDKQEASGQQLQPQSQPAIPATPSEAINFNARVNEIAAAERIRTESARAAAEAASLAAKRAEEGILLQLEGASELSRLQRRGGLLGVFQTIADDGVGQAFADIAGRSKARAQDRIRRGQAVQKISAIESQAAEAEIAARTQERLLPFSTAKQQFALAKDVINIEQEQESLSIRRSNAQNAKQRLFFDIQTEQRKARLNAKEDFLEPLTIQAATSLLQSLDTNEMNEFETADANTGVKFKLTRDELIQHVKNRQVLEAEREAALALAQAGRVESLDTVHEQILAKLPVSQQRAVLANGGLYMYEDTNGEMQQIQFDPRMVTRVVTEAEEARNQASQQLGALGPEEDPLIQESLNLASTTAEVFHQTQLRLETLFPNGSLSGDLRLQSAEVRNNLNEVMRVSSDLNSGRIAMTPAIREEFNEGVKEVNQQVRNYARNASKQFAAGDEDIENFVFNRLTGSFTNPEVVANAFSVLAVNNQSVLTAASSPAAQGALDSFNKRFGQLIDEAMLQNGAVQPPVGNQKVVPDLLQNIIASKKNEKGKLDKGTLQRLEREALAFAGQNFNDDVRDSLLRGDFRMLPLASQQELIEHPFVDLPLETAFRRAEKRFEKIVQNQRGDLESAEAERAFLGAYASVLQEIPINDPKFSNGFEVYQDFLKNPGIRSALQGLSRGESGGTIADQASVELFGAETATFLDSRLRQIEEIGIDLGIEAEEALQTTRQAYRNNGIKRLQEVLIRMPAEVIGEDQIRPFVREVMGAIQTNNARNGLKPGEGMTNARIESFVLSQEFDNPELERIRKKVAREWKTVAPITDRGFFVEQNKFEDPNK